MSTRWARRTRPTPSRVRSGRRFCSRDIDGEAGAQPIAGGVCYCCKTALAAGANGGIYAAWRQVYAGNIRDIAFARSTDGRTFAPPARVSEDNWMLDGCPENGPSLAVDARDRVHVVWPTLLPAADSTSEPTLALFYAMSADGRTFTPRARIPTAGVARHPQVALGSRDELFIVWDEQDGGTRRVAAARAEDRREGYGDVRAAAIGGHRASRISGRGQRQRRGRRRVDQRVRRVEHDQADARGPLAPRTPQPITSIVNPPGAVK